MRTKIMICLCFALLMSSLVSCGTKSSVADDINDPSVPYDPEPYAEQQISTIEEYIQLLARYAADQAAEQIIRRVRILILLAGQIGKLMMENHAQVILRGILADLFHRGVSGILLQQRLLYDHSQREGALSDRMDPCGGGNSQSLRR